VVKAAHPFKKRMGGDTHTLFLGTMVATPPPGGNFAAPPVVIEEGKKKKGGPS